MRKKLTASIEIEGKHVPVKVVIEHRANARYTISSKSVTLRVPRQYQPEHLRAELRNLQNWVQKTVAEKPSLHRVLFGKIYATGDILQVGPRRYFLEVNESDRATHAARLVGDTIVLDLSGRADPVQRTKSAKTLLSRIVGADFLPEMTARVHEINRLTVNRPVGRVFLKYNHSNWGSCSVKGNINLSTRLLFAPQDVQDYLILHELAHLVEMNHSDRYWALVSRFMPDYQEKERWLKEHRDECDF